MATTNEVEILKFTAEFGDIQQRLKDLEAQLRKLGKAEEEVTTEQKKGVTEMLSASQKRKAALATEQAELKKLQTSLKGAFSAPEIEKFNSAITKTKNNISLLKGETGGLGKVTDGLKSQFAGLGAGIAAAFTVDAVIAFGKASIDAFLEADANAQRLKNSLNEVGAEGQVAFEKLIKQSQRLAQTGVTIFTDDDIQKAQAQLALYGLTADEIEKLIPKLADYASATQQNIVDASEKVGNALLGNGREFKKYGIVVSATATTTENFTSILGGLGKFEGQAAEATQTLTGQLADQKRQVDELQESVGERLAPAWVSAKRVFLDLINAITGGSNGGIETRLKNLNVAVRESDLIIGQTSGNIKDKYLKSYIDLAGSIGVYDDAILKSNGSTEVFNKSVTALANKQKLLNTATDEGLSQYQIITKGIEKLTETYRSLNISLKTTTDYSKMATAELEKLVADGAVGDELILIKRVLKAREEEAKLIAKNAEAAKKANDKRLEDEKKANDARLAEANRLAGAKTAIDQQIQDDAKKQIEKNADDTEKANQEIIKQDQKLNLALAQQDLAAFDEKEKAKTEALKKAEEERLALNKQALQAAIDGANAIADAIFTIQKNNLERSQTLETSALQTEKEKALSNKRLTESEKERINKEFAAKELALKKKQFEENKRQATAQAILKGALAIVETFAELGYPAGIIPAALVAAETAAQIAIIQAQKFAKGKKEKQKGGPAYVGEQGMEFMYVPDNAMIVDAQKTRRHKALINAMMDGNLDDYLEKSFVLPRLQSHLKTFETNKEKSFSNNVAKALIFHGLTPVQAEKIRRKGITINNAEEIARALAPLLSHKPDPRRF